MAPPSDSQQTISVKLKAGNKNRLEAAVRDIRAQYGPLLDMWRELPDDKRRAVLDHSPLLAKLLDGVV